MFREGIEAGNFEGITLDTEVLILLGFYNPKLFKRSVWRRTQSIMEKLISKTDRLERVNTFGGIKYQLKNNQEITAVTIKELASLL